MIAAEIAAALGDSRREGLAWRCRCPVHGGRSLTLRDGERGRVLATCWAGCDRLDVLAELKQRGMLDGDRRGDQRGDQVTRIAGDHSRHQDHVLDDHTRRVARALRVWNATLPAARSPAASYLARRGIELERWPASLRWHPCCPRPCGEPMPAMVAVVEHVARGTTGIHRTYLTAEHRRYDRATLGFISGAAVRLGTPRMNEWLAISEGIETALAMVAACDMPAWAALSAGGIRSLTLPPEATHIIICADHDASGTGERAARDAAARWVGEGRQVRIAMPPEPDTDMADLLAAAAATEARHVA